MDEVPLHEGPGRLWLCVLHCGAGIGRAGTIAAALLMRGGLSHDEALARVASSRPMAGPEAGAQRDLLVALSHVDTG